uniref:Uncharacterized protein n=1 Tax=Cannabis sativa TaxID=3483 RepID=A0A803QBY5_CANSA
MSVRLLGKARTKAVEVGPQKGSDASVSGKPPKRRTRTTKDNENPPPSPLVPKIIPATATQLSRENIAMPPLPPPHFTLPIRAEMTEKLCPQVGTDVAQFLADLLDQSATTICKLGANRFAMMMGGDPVNMEEIMRTKANVHHKSVMDLLDAEDRYFFIPQILALVEADKAKEVAQTIEVVDPRTTLLKGENLYDTTRPASVVSSVTSYAISEVYLDVQTDGTQVP